MNRAPLSRKDRQTEAAADLVARLAAELARLPPASYHAHALRVSLRRLLEQIAQRIDCEHPTLGAAGWCLECGQRPGAEYGVAPIRRAWLELAQLLGLDVHDTERPPPGELAGPTCETPGCGRSIPPGGEGVPETCPACLDETKHGAS